MEKTTEQQKPKSNRHMIISAILMFIVFIVAAILWFGETTTFWDITLEDINSTLTINESGYVIEYNDTSCCTKITGLDLSKITVMMENTTGKIQFLNITEELAYCLYFNETEVWLEENLSKC